MTPDTSLSREGLILADGVRKYRGKDAVYSSGALQTWDRSSGRYAEGRFSDISLQQGSASAARFINRHGLRHRAVPGIDPMIASDRANSGFARPPSEQLRPIPEWMAIGHINTMMQRITQSARDHDHAVERVVIDFDLSDSALCLTDGVDVYQENRLLSYLTIRVIARRGDRVATGFYTPGVSDTLDRIDAEASGREVAKRAVAGLAARPAPVGHMPIVVAGGRGIVMLHEACCHPLEGDEVVRGSIYASRVGEAIASPLVSVTDDPTVAGAVGSYVRDDEGVLASPTPLIVDGVLSGFLTDSDSAARLTVERSGNGRCRDASYPPLPRMSNTCLANGESSVDDLIASTESGIYAENIGGGEMIESTGEFTFRVTNGYRIENGRVTDPISETTISGTGESVLNGIDGVANDSSVGAAKCGKFGQWVTVGVVGPTLRVKSLFVGGTQS